MIRAVMLAAGLLSAAPQPPGAFAAEEAEMVVAARTVRAGDVIEASDLAMASPAEPGALADPAEAVGMEARVTLVKGRAVTPASVKPPAVVERNQIVTMTFARGALTIVADGRALGRASVGERVRVMNLDSRTTVTATVSGPGQVEIR